MSSKTTHTHTRAHTHTHALYTSITNRTELIIVKYTEHFQTQIILLEVVIPNTMHSEDPL